MYDDMIARGAWSGAHLELRKRMADYLVDGVRLGTVDWRSRSGSRNDARLHRDSAEALTAALILALLRHTGIAIRSTDSLGKKLERPDLDVTFADGIVIGVEAADVTSTAQGKHESEVASLVAHVRDLIDNDPSFASAFGNNHVTVFLASPLLEDSRIKSRAEASRMYDETVAFIRARERRRSTSSSKLRTQVGPRLWVSRLWVPLKRQMFSTSFSWAWVVRGDATAAFQLAADNQAGRVD